MKLVALTGRIFFALIFIMSGLSHLPGEGIDYATAAGVPAARFLVPFGGLISLLGGVNFIGIQS